MVKPTKLSSSNGDQNQSAEYTKTLTEISRLVPKSQIDAFVSAYGENVGLQKAKETYQKRLERGGELKGLERKSIGLWEETDLRDLDDMRLVRRGNNGDLRSVVGILYSRYHDRIRNFIWGYVKEDDIADEITQDTFIRVQEKLFMYKETYAVSTWIFTIAANLAKNYLRRDKKEGDVFTESIDEIENAENLFPDRREVPSNKKLVLEREIRKLPLKYREVFLLNAVNEHPYEIISKMLETPIGTIKSRINRAKQILRKGLSKSIISDLPKIG